MCNKVAGGFLRALKLVPDWLFTSKKVKNFHIASYADENVFFFDEYSGDATFSCNQMGILSADLNNINLDDTNYDEDDHETIFHIILLSWHIKFENCKKKSIN